MGGAQSIPLQAPQRPGRRAARPESHVYMYSTLDEKFDAVRIENSAAPDAAGPSDRVLDNDSETVSVVKAQEYVKKLLKDPKNQLGLSALSTNNINAILEKNSTVLHDTHTFNLSIPHEGLPVTNQRSSGRCWIFAACNTFRIAIMQKHNIQKFELSQSYLFFWDKIEKANYFLESVLTHTNEEVDGRLFTALNASPVGDGGQWDMIVNLVEKYGIVPQTLYPDSYNAKSSGAMDTLLTTKLRQDGLELRKLKANGASASSITASKEAMLQDVIRIVTLCLGPPPAADDKFTWEFYDRSNKLKTVSLTPLEFAESAEVDKFVSLVNDPRNDYMSLLTVSNLGNVWDGRPVSYINVDTIVLKEACVAMLRKGSPIFFGSDVGKQFDSTKGIMDTDLIDYELGFNVKLGMTKAERLLTGESQMTHAMVLTAVHLDKDDMPVRWRVENSWSDAAGVGGYFVMSDKWMDEFCYQAVIDKSVLGKAVKDVLKQEPKVLPLWDPMGALA